MGWRLLLKDSSSKKRSQSNIAGPFWKNEIQIDHEKIKNIFRLIKVLTEEQKKLAIAEHDKRNGL